MRGARGFSLVEVVLASALSLLILAAVLPLVVGTRHLVAAASSHARNIDGGRLAAVRMLRDSRAAGFGLDVATPAAEIDASGTGLSIHLLEGGFEGGRRVVEPVAAGGTSLVVESLDGLTRDDPVVLIDRHGRHWTSRVRAVEPASRRVDLNDAVPYDVGPADGARLYRRTIRQWELDGSGLRRNRQPLVEPAGLQVESGATPAPSRAGDPISRPFAGAMEPDAAAIQANLEVRDEAGAVRVRRGVSLWLYTRLRHVPSLRLSSSPLP